MTAAIPARVGQVANAGNVDALFQTIFSGEILARFAEVNVTLSRHMVRTIMDGKSADFPTVGNFSASYHVPGAELVGKQNNHNQRTITVDDLLVADAFVAKIDELKNHWDVRSEYSRKLAEALSNQMDRHVLQVMAKAARTVTGVSGMPGGSILTHSEVAGATDFNNPVQFLDALAVAAATLDEKDVPQEGRTVYVKPAMFYKLIRDRTALNKDWDGAGSFAQATLPQVMGFEIVSTNHLPRTNIVSGVEAGGTAARHAGDFTNTFALIVQREAVGTVKLLDLNTEIAPDPRRRGTLMIAEYAVGHDVLRPECAIELQNVA